MENSPVNRLLGVEAEDLIDGSVRLHLAVDERHHNEIGVVHGGITSFLLDGAMGRAAGRDLPPGSSCATVQLSVQFLAPAQGRLTAHGRVVRRSKSVAFLEGECVREDGQLIGRAQGTWWIRAPRAAEPQR